MRIRIGFQFIFIIVLLVFSCKEEHKKIKEDKMENSYPAEPNKQDFIANVDGKPVDLQWIKNSNGIKAAFVNYGQRLVALYVPDAKGNFKDIVLITKVLN